jgi:hypothetical protein
MSDLINEGFANERFATELMGHLSGDQLSGAVAYFSTSPDDWFE